jgi:hypothetical protein
MTKPTVHNTIRQKRKKKKTMSINHAAIISISYTTILPPPKIFTLPPETPCIIVRREFVGEHIPLANFLLKDFDDVK